MSIFESWVVDKVGNCELRKPFMAAVELVSLGVKPVPSFVSALNLLIWLWAKIKRAHPKITGTLRNFPWANWL